ncbi:ligand-dependent nuclear receptor-interacting factor 1 isoform X2 [Latimeria chalumnae]|uniref:ligand-dependent nuclear receptor-interacting factor 1 isoform X2 n=1 Tax=Latimeria chalumnae TaxID=7897 RepID=UPI0003C1AE77|nr:PREDICTED: ligand-dependent nuclear receptor-interacting factor 1 isoform X2 [Latimeria chalumnae]|eukprot:XP_005987652.1 PREDICTED: ligand-dependent nuclear receptor-interacting factor 1 isoform X2 [Latimeria chalumnae]
MNNLQRVVVTTADNISSNTTQCIADCLYQVVQITDANGKNILKLIPASKISRSVAPTIPSSSITKGSEVNMLTPVTLQLQTTAMNSISSEVSDFHHPTKKLFVTRPVDPKEILGVTHGPTVVTSGSPISLTKNAALTVANPSSQRLLASSSNSKDKMYMLISSKHLPGTVKSVALPSGQHIRIPADAQVKSLAASSFSPAIQEKILVTAATNISGTNEANKTPASVIYVSPVNTVKTVVTKPLPVISPKPVVKPSTSLTRITEAYEMENRFTTGMIASPALPTSNNIAQSPMKWVVQENPQFSAPCLVPVKSSTNAASQILKSLAADLQHVEQPLSTNAAMPLLSTNSPESPSVKSAAAKKNALVMCNGKVYFMAKQGPEVGTTSPKQNQSKDQATCSQSNEVQNLQARTLDSVAISKISKAVRAVLSKNMGSKLPQINLPRSEKSVQTTLKRHVKTEACQEFPSTKKENQRVLHVKPQNEELQRENGDLSNFSVSKEREEILNTIPKNISLMSSELYGRTGDMQQHSDPSSDTMFSSVKETLGRSKEKGLYNESDDQLRKKFGLNADVRVHLNKIPIQSFSVVSKKHASPSAVTEMEDPSGMEFMTKLDSPMTKNIEGNEVKIKSEQGSARKRKSADAEIVGQAKKRPNTFENSSNRDSESPCSTSSGPNSKRFSSKLVKTQERFPANSEADSKVLFLEQKSEESSNSNSAVEKENMNSILGTSAEPEKHHGEICTGDFFPVEPLDSDITPGDEKIRKLKELLREREAALEEIRKKMFYS